jgi:hypothetical protein
VLFDRLVIGGRLVIASTRPTSPNHHKHLIPLHPTNNNHQKYNGELVGVQVVVD